MRLLGLGDNVIDYYTNTGAVYPGGNAFNAAVHASILGAEAAYMGNLVRTAAASGRGYGILKIIFSDSQFL